MALNIDLMLMLTLELRQALITVNRCSSEIDRLLEEQQQLNKAAQSMEHRNSPDKIEPVPSPWSAVQVPHTRATKRQRLVIDSSDEELEDALLLAAGILHEQNSTAPTHILQPGDLGSAAAQSTATLKLSQPASWISSGHNTLHLDKPTGIE